MRAAIALGSTLTVTDIPVSRQTHCGAGFGILTADAALGMLLCSERTFHIQSVLVLVQTLRPAPGGNATDGGAPLSTRSLQGTALQPGVWAYNTVNRHSKGRVEFHGDYIAGMKPKPPSDAPQELDP